jgi:hypothetical protein
LRRSPRDSGDLIDVVRSGRARVDPAGHAVLQDQCRPILAPPGMGVDVDQACRDDLSTCIDRVGGFAHDVSFDRGDLPTGNRHIADASSTEGSITRPPLIIRSWVASSTFGTRASSAAPTALA